MRASRAKFNDFAAPRCRDDPRRLTGDHGLITQCREQISLHNLAFNNRRDDSQKRFTGKHQASFRHGPDITAETKCLQIVEEFVADIAKNRMIAKIGNLVRRKMNMFQKVQCLFESGGNQRISLGREMADKQLKGSGGVKTGLNVQPYFIIRYSFGGLSAMAQTAPGASGFDVG